MKTLTIEHHGKTQTLEVSESLSPAIDGATTYLVVGPGYYGYGESLKVARANCVKEGCPRTAKMLAFLGDDTLGVSGMGAVSSKVILLCLGEI